MSTAGLKLKYASVVKRLSQETFNLLVVGSNPTGGTDAKHVFMPEQVRPHRAKSEISQIVHPEKRNALRIMTGN